MAKLGPKTSIVVLLGTIALFFFFKYLPLFQFGQHSASSRRETYLLKKLDKMRRDRKQFAKVMNEDKQDLAYLTCKLRKIQGHYNGSKARASKYGGFCEDAKMKGIDRGLARGICKFFNKVIVGSFGDGRGDYKRFFDNCSNVIRYDSFDGAFFREKQTNGLTKFLDLTAPHYGLPIYDWVLSIEVAEHIPKQFEEVFLSNLVRHAKSGIILSWAAPHQRGVGHVNTQPAEYVIKTMAKLGFTFDLSVSEKFRHNARLGHLKNNVMVFFRKKAHPIDPEEARKK